jgi:dihydrofolate synthase/folylpolyglutamate synthase
VRLLELAQDAGVSVTADAIGRGLTGAAWPARLERLRMRDGRDVILDAAHNADGAATLSEYLRRWHPERPALVVGVMRDKDTAAIVEPLLPCVSHVIATEAPTPRALPASELESRVRGLADRLPVGRRPLVSRVDDPLQAVTEALKMNRLVIVAGSIFLVGPVRERLVPRAILPQGPGRE